MALDLDAAQDLATSLFGLDGESGSSPTIATAGRAQGTGTAWIASIPHVSTTVLPGKATGTGTARQPSILGTSTPPVVSTFSLVAGFIAEPSGSTYGFYDDSVYNTATYAPDVIEHDITRYARDSGFTITRGVSDIVTTGFVANAATYEGTLDNRDRRFDPNNTAGPYRTAGINRVVPGVPLIARGNYAGNAFDIFTGRVDEWPQNYPNIGVDQTIELKATDLTGLLSTADIQTKRPAEYSGARIAAILSLCGYDGPTAISHGNQIVGPLQFSQISAMSHIEDVVNAEWGEWYVDKSGVPTFRSRDDILSDNRSRISQATFGDAGTELRYSDIQMGSPPIINDVTIIYNDKGATVRSQDLSSQAQPWRRRSLGSQALPIFQKPAAQQYADWIIQRYGNPVTTFASISFKPARDPGNLWSQALGRELGDRITVKRTPLGGGARLSTECFIRGIRHEYADRAWTTTFTLQDAGWTSNLARYDVSKYDVPSGSPDVYAL